MIDLLQHFGNAFNAVMAITVVGTVWAFALWGMLSAIERWHRQ